MGLTNVSGRSRVATGRSRTPLGEQRAPRRLEEEMRRHRVAGVSIIVMSMLVSACSGSSSPLPSQVSSAPTSAAPAGSAPANSAPASAPAPSGAGGTVGGGGNIVIVTPLEPDNLDIGQMSVSTSFSPIGRNIFETLVGRDSKTNALAPQLALSWTNPQPTVWDFQLRQGVTFHDGTPFDAAGAVTSMTKLYDAKTDGIGDFVGAAATFKATGPYTLEMTTATPDPIVPDRMTEVPLASPKQLTQDPASMATDPIGTGPYEFVKWVKGQELDLKLDPQAWRAKPGMFDTVQWEWRQDETVREQMIQTGEADVVNFLTEDQCSGAVKCEVQPTSETYWVRMDKSNQALLGDVRVRQAVAMALDRPTIAQTLLGGVPVYDTLAPAGATGFDPNLVGYKYDLAGAKDLLNQAAASGVDLSLPLVVGYFTSDGAAIAQMSTVLAQSLKGLGLNVTTKAYQDSDYDKVFVWGDGQTQANTPKNRGLIWVARTGGELFDTQIIFDLFASCTGRLSVYCNPAVDAAVAAAAPLGGDARDQALRAAWKTLYADVGILAIAPVPNNYAFSDRVNVTTTAIGWLPLWEASAK